MYDDFILGRAPDGLMTVTGFKCLLNYTLPRRKGCIVTVASRTGKKENCYAASLSSALPLSSHGTTKINTKPLFLTFLWYFHGPNIFSKDFSSSFLSCFSWVVKSVCLLFNGLNLRLKQEFAFGISKYVIKVQDFDFWFWRENCYFSNFCLPFESSA